MFNQRVTGTHLRKLQMSGQSWSCSRSHGCIRKLSSSNDGSSVKWKVDSPDTASRIVNCFRMGYAVRGVGSSVTNSQSKMWTVLRSVPTPAKIAPRSKPLE